MPNVRIKKINRNTNGSTVGYDENFAACKLEMTDENGASNKGRFHLR